MPGSGGSADKLGNYYEALWTVNAFIDVFLGKATAITVEAFGDESEGVEFHLELRGSKLQFHSVKRQKQNGDWSIADLCRSDKKTGRSILGDLFAKCCQFAGSELRFVSATGANELKEMCERAGSASDVAQFRQILSIGLQKKFDGLVVSLFSGDDTAAFDALKSLKTVLHDHGSLERHVEDRVDLLFYRIDGEPLSPGDVRRGIAEYVLNHLGVRLTTAQVRSYLQSCGLGTRDWRTDPTIRDTVEKIKARYLSSVEAELINAAQIARKEANLIADAVCNGSSRGALLVAPGGFGKSCVLAQCLSELSDREIPVLCLRMDTIESCTTARQMGRQLDLPAEI